ncbi:hypothetical protein VCRA2123O444_210044 [Vibrio crassostreae]|nr:hypothetical protein VCRA2117O428_180082 [Vibrio crassostreae]CAK1816358.1 hypothetical protein VCRA2113O416_180082 [Vibrio crassostreae]CAK1877803.1 hypothetical protein VCRA2114O422_200081 [Vibrio crassostreae]CAK1881633.1 hypothetical protein VCRA2119O430_200044 [Vibrio crassostreae]CAK1891335.1 hypothetical protein VCRA2118O429_200021 [Vibrio crassostreae]
MCNQSGVCELYGLLYNESQGHCYCSSIKVEGIYVAVSLFKLNFIETLCCL